MWPIIARVFGRFNRYLQLPIAGLIGYIGYHIEGLISDRYTPSTASIKQQREDRQLEDTDSTSNKKAHRPLEINLPPSLSA
ncbi:small integral membrane protein 12 [Halictus rubicundus]|uniref:small integral membrane protein 12 n=1 Tax=Halictus rubicundus TaxID=77578 RepID=UPI004037082D